MASNVIEIGKFALTRKPSNSFDKTRCEHENLTLDDNGQSVICNDCNMSLSAYWTLERLIHDYKKAWEALERKRLEVKEDMEKTAHTKAAKDVEKAWRSRTMLPSCPHCKRGIASTDGFGINLTSREFEMSVRERDRKK